MLGVVIPQPGPAGECGTLPSDSTSLHYSPRCPSSCSSSHDFMTGAMRAMRSAACCLILALLLFRRHLMVPHTYRGAVVMGGPEFRVRR